MNKEELLEWAKSLQKDYETKLGFYNSDVTFFSFADSAKDFIDKFIDTFENEN